ncbi:proline dehydrogenase family protein, partial [Asaia sp. SF2.1]
RPALSLRLSSLHPRFETTQRDRVMNEVLPVLVMLAQRAMAANVILQFDAETGDKLELCLD